MIFSTSRTIASLGKRVVALRNLRKVKCFVQGNATTVVIYYKDTTQAGRLQYKGQAYIFSYKNWKGTCVTLAHTSHLPPPSEQEVTEEQEQTEVEIEPSPKFPGFGCSQLSHSSI